MVIITSRPHIAHHYGDSSNGEEKVINMKKKVTEGLIQSFTSQLVDFSVPYMKTWIHLGEDEIRMKARFNTSENCQKIVRFLKYINMVD